VKVLNQADEFRSHEQVLLVENLVKCEPLVVVVVRKANQHGSLLNGIARVSWIYKLKELSAVGLENEIKWIKNN
jgi:hypothetical protein